MPKIGLLRANTIDVQGSWSEWRSVDWGCRRRGVLRDDGGGVLYPVPEFEWDVAPEMPMPAWGKLAHPASPKCSHRCENVDVEADAGVLLLDSVDLDNSFGESRCAADHVQAKPHHRGGTVASPNADLVEQRTNVWL